MRFTKKRFPMLYFLSGDQAKDGYEISCVKDNRIDIESVWGIIETYRGAIHDKEDLIKLTDIAYLTQSFEDAIEDSKGKLWEGTGLEKELIFPQCSGYIMCSKGYSYLWTIHSNALMPDSIVDVIMMNGGTVKSIVQYSNGHTVGFFNNGVDTLSPEREKEVMESILVFPFSFIAFKKYAPKKQKICPPKKKIKDFHCQYKNDSSLPIEIYDLNYFTESRQDNPFMVRGHWRLQKYGPGLADVKLIFIDSFWKKGYTKGANMDNESDAL